MFCFAAPLHLLGQWIGRLASIILKSLLFVTGIIWSKSGSGLVKQECVCYVYIHGRQHLYWTKW